VGSFLHFGSPIIFCAASGTRYQSLNATLLLLVFLLYGSVKRSPSDRSMPSPELGCDHLYHLYAGVAGLVHSPTSATEWPAGGVHFDRLHLSSDYRFGRAVFACFIPPAEVNGQSMGSSRSDSDGGGGSVRAGCWRLASEITSALLTPFWYVWSPASRAWTSHLLGMDSLRRDLVCDWRIGVHLCAMLRFLERNAVN